MFCKHIGAGHSAGYLRVYCTLPALVSVPGSKEQDLTLTAPWPKYPDAYCVLACERRVPASAGKVLEKN